MFQDGGGSGAPADCRGTLALCARCPVADECAAAGAHERFGVWGGMTPSARGYGKRRRGDPAA
ncbi:MAG: WhiB family transcriptional regulator [Acidimicrobiales bacterium]